MEKEPTLKGLNGFEPPGKVFFGVGLCNKHSLTKGMPIDILGMMLLAEKLGKEKHVLIADANARGNGFRASDVESVAQRQKETLLRLCQNLKLEGWHFNLGSEIAKTQDYWSILNSISHTSEYVRMELADIAWFRKNFGTNLKVGWALNGSNNVSETFFDQIFMQMLGDNMSFAYTVPGRTFDSSKPKSSPYFCDNPKVRILLQRSEDVSLKIAEAKRQEDARSTNGCLNFLKGIVRTWDSVFGSHENGKVAERLQGIVETCTA